jgi:tRNA wybutosine-synthesizing protein 4
MVLMIATFAILEQILPAGPTHPFAVTMQNHFNKLTTPLHSLAQYPTLRSQGRRFLEAGYSEIEACDLNTFFNGVIAKEDRIAAFEMELFDEYEELGAFLGHYFILVARNISTPGYFSIRGHDWQYIKWNKDILLNGNMTASYHCHQANSCGEQLMIRPIDDLARLHRRFSAIASTTNGFLVQGGLSNTTRLSSPLKVCPASDTTVFTSSLTCPPPRMCHTLTPLGDGKVLLVGGREAPKLALCDVWLFDEQWKQLDCLPGGGIYRHTAVQIGPEQVVLFGGRRNGGQTSSNWYIYSRQKGWQSLRCDDSPSLWGASLAWEMGQGVLVGGVDSDDCCSGDVYTWSLDPNFFAVTLKRWTLSPSILSLTRRYGARLIQRKDDSGFLCIGGAGSHRLLPWSEQFLNLDPVNEVVELVEVQAIASTEPWLIGHDVSIQGTTRDTFILGGGGVCFSFGSFWNDRILRVQQDSNDFSSSEPWIIRKEATSTPLQRTFAVLSGQPTPVRRTRIDTPEQWHDILQSSEACVLEGLDFGSCMGKWTPEYLKSAVGPDRSVVIHSTDVEAMNFLAKNFKYTSRSFSDFIDSVFSDAKEKVYLRAVSDDAKSKPARLEDDFPGLAKDFNIPNILCGEGGIEVDRIFSTVLRVGGVGTSMWLHYDVYTLS